MKNREWFCIEWDGRATAINRPSIDEEEVLRRLNAYDELLEALQNLVADYEEIGGPDFFDDSYKIAKQAIATPSPPETA